ncbi:MAG: hypothetical protein ABS43_17700 [Bordetella sp. SCN 67-23]|nr:hypothetical protein [Burkholderiales bacterium]ODS72350.1 MAG: hypothetical protein ABS43_17700 [Bordetella sp. SCN 67-23]OJW86870.1 MAG: hypothetical protein BGO71_26410 [Burkholderiales bacterium 67-32]
MKSHKNVDYALTIAQLRDLQLASSRQRQAALQAAVTQADRELAEARQTTAAHVSLAQTSMDQGTTLDKLLNGRAAIAHVMHLERNAEQASRQAQDERDAHSSSLKRSVAQAEAAQRLLERQRKRARAVQAERQQMTMEELLVHRRKPT